MSGSPNEHASSPAHDLARDPAPARTRNTDRFRVTSHFITAQDGLRLHVRAYDPAEAHAAHRFRAPLLCLPGLTRNANEFDVIARAMAGGDHAPRRVLAVDYRGRGLSQRDANPLNYNVPMEAADVLAALDALDVGRAIILGSSRGGLIAMNLAVTRPTMLAGVIFNDIGPVIELEGLLRIKSYAGKLQPPRDFDEAVAQQKVLFGAQFPGISEDDWHGLAMRAWRMPETLPGASISAAHEDGEAYGDAYGEALNAQDVRAPAAPPNPDALSALTPALIATCDPMVAMGLMMLTPDTKLPPAWEAFDALAGVPLMVLRGEHSDLLSRTTVHEMARRRPDMVALEVEGQGHTPLLNDAPTIGKVAAFIARSDFVSRT